MQNLTNELRCILGDEKSGCKVLKSVTAKELEKFERENSFLLPDDYKFLLTQFGSLELFCDDYSAGIEILMPWDVKNFSHSVFEGYGTDLYPDIFLAVNLPSVGWFGGFDLNASSEKNFAIFFPEVDPEFWIKEANFISFKQWLNKAISSKGKGLLLY